MVTHRDTAAQRATFRCKRLVGRRVVDENTEMVGEGLPHAFGHRQLRGIGQECPDLVARSVDGHAVAPERIAAMREKAREDGLEMEILTHPHSDQAGAIGAALWAAYRQRMLDRRATKIA